MRRNLALWLFAGIVGFWAFGCMAAMLTSYQPPEPPMWTRVWPSAVQAVLVFTFAVIAKAIGRSRSWVVVLVLGTASALPWYLMALLHLDAVFEGPVLTVLPFAFGGYGFALGGVMVAKRIRQESTLARMPCLKCGYELESLLAGSRCPECGEEQRSMEASMPNVPPQE